MLLAFLLLGPHAAVQAQKLSGFVEGKGYWYVNRSTERDPWLIGWHTAYLKAEGKTGDFRWLASLRLEAISSHERGPLVFDLASRGLRRSPVVLHELWARLPLSPSMDLSAGRFELGWGKTDGYSPADAFLPRDLSDPFADEKIPVWGVRLNGQLGALRFDGVFSPVLTPSRLPVLSGRNAPVASPDTRVEIYLVDGESSPPLTGFGALRLMLTEGDWDIGLWGRTGSRPSPLLDIRRDQAEIRPDGVAVPARRYWAREDAAGFEVSRVVGGIVLRAELAALFSDDASLQDALIWTVGGEKAFGDGNLLVTVAANARPTPIDPLLLFDRAILPALIGIWSRTEEWGSWRLVWMQGLSHGDGLVKAELTYNVTDVLQATCGTEIPYGSRHGPFGSRPDTGRMRLGIRHSW
ncbi:MAG: hypothetical protein DIJKHBIC_00605 [Thermoanaerobaculia bacterium]|nr:hypothetical protein [Thermoanaerobaculia bacterium]